MRVGQTPDSRTIVPPRRSGRPQREADFVDGIYFARLRLRRFRRLKEIPTA
jgi:hypothetical protein